MRSTVALLIFDWGAMGEFEMPKAGLKCEHMDCQALPEQGSIADALHLLCDTCWRLCTV
jgi:hypothetical protein